MIDKEGSGQEGDGGGSGEGEGDGGGGGGEGDGGGGEGKGGGGDGGEAGVAWKRITPGGGDGREGGGRVGEAATIATRNGLKLKPCPLYKAAELPKNGKRRVVSLLPRLSVVSIIIATRHSAPVSHAAIPLARMAYTPSPWPAADASKLLSSERPDSAAPSS